MSRLRGFLRLFAVQGLLVLGASSAAAAEDLSRLGAARDSITYQELQAHVETLADDSFEGREAGSRGGRAAGNYLLKSLTRKTAPGGADHSHVQMFGAGYRNLLGRREGSDSDLKHEVIIFGAHYDHVGYGFQRNSFGPAGYIHNGADDNASGVSVLMEVVDAIDTADVPLRRTVLFALWDGEERGLLGSEHWIQSPTLPLNQVRLVINLDMVGRLQGRPLEVLGTRTQSGLRQTISRANDNPGLTLQFPWKIERNSDHHTFFQRQIPVLMFHTGLHGEYHRPSDDAHLIDVDGLQAVSKLALNSLVALANEDDLPRFRRDSRYQGDADLAEFEQPLPRLPSRLGITWKRPSEPTAPIVVSSVQYGSAAEQAGVQVGDEIIALAGRPILNSSMLQSGVLILPSASELTVRREGNDDPLTLAVNLTGDPVRLGITWREDPAEMGTVTVVRVVPHSACDLAGLKLRDRIHQIGGHRFTDSKQFLELAKSLPFPLPVEVERAGQLKTLTIQSPDPWEATIEEESADLDSSVPHPDANDQPMLLEARRPTVTQ